MLHGSFAGPLGASPLTPAVQDFLNQVRKRPQDFKKLLLTVTLHPDPVGSAIWGRQSFTFDKQTRYLIDEILMSEQSGQPEVVVRDELRRIALANFKQEIEAEWHLNNEMINTARGLGYALLSPFIMDPLLLPEPPDPRKLCKLAREVAQKMLPQDLVRRIMNSDASEAHLTWLGKFLRGYAQGLLRPGEKHFRKLVEIARRWQREGKLPPL